MPELKTPWGYYAVLGFIGAAITLMIWQFRSRGWINWGRRRFARIKLFEVEKGKLKGYIRRVKRVRRQSA